MSTLGFWDMRSQSIWSNRLIIKLFHLIIVMLAIASASLLAEGGLRFFRHHAERQAHIAPGLIRPDATLGWILSPSWTGTHDHHDYHVRYETGMDGFRLDPAPPRKDSGSVCAILGDSFAFGLGVNDDQTFAHLLNEKGPQAIQFLNWSVPGYSTDQEALLLERQLEIKKPNVVLLVVYLGNDLLDNMRSIPLQLNLPKPRYELSPSGLVLHLPEPASELLGSSAARESLAAAALGRAAYRGAFLGFAERHSVLAGMLCDQLLPTPDVRPVLQKRLRPSLELFSSLLDQISLLCEKKGPSLHVLLLAGRSYVQDPSSLSSQYQEYLRSRIALVCASRHLPFLDLASQMRKQFSATSREWFYRNDGHLTPAGHNVVAELVASYLAQKTSG